MLGLGLGAGGFDPCIVAPEGVAGEKELDATGDCDGGGAGRFEPDVSPLAGVGEVRMVREAAAAAAMAFGIPRPRPAGAVGEGPARPLMALLSGALDLLSDEPSIVEEREGCKDSTSEKMTS